MTTMLCRLGLDTWIYGRAFRTCQHCHRTQRKSFTGRWVNV